MCALVIVIYESNLFWDAIIVEKEHTYFYNSFIPSFHRNTNCGYVHDITDFHQCEMILDHLKTDLNKPGEVYVKCQHNSSCKIFTPINLKYLSYEMNGYILSAFTMLLCNSVSYRSIIRSRFIRIFKLQNTCKDAQITFLLINLTTCKNYIDYKWNDRIEKMIIERRELGECMAWLSTLGGAFSALGDKFGNCAVVAGRISVRQLSIALRLGDPLLVARCKLYFALSLIQRGKLLMARHLIEDQYKLAKSLPVLDMCLIRMCFGIWAKLKYAYKLRNSKKLKSNGHFQIVQLNGKKSHDIA